MLDTTNMSADDARAIALKFIKGKSKDHRGRTVADYLKFDDFTLENDHEWIQWAFPIDTISVHNKYAGRLAWDASGHFKYKSAGRTNQLELVKLYLASIGIEFPLYRDSVDLDKFVSVVSSPNNHHMKRISRLLKHLRLTGDNYSSDEVYRVIVRHVIMARPAYFNPATVAYWSSIVLNFDYSTKELM